MHKNPFITIITVTFNAEKVINKTLKSLQKQTYQDFEHLVIDGKSKDDTLKIINHFSLPQTHIISESDKGLYDAMNKGLRLAKGKYVLFLNAGDAFHSNDTLSNYAEQAKKNADIIYGDTVIVSPEGEVLGPRHLSVPDNLTNKSFANGMLICHQAFMVKKELVSEYNLRYRFSADYDWCIRSIKQSNPSKRINLHQVTIDYLSEGLTDKNKWKSLRERFKIMSHHYGFIPTLFNHFRFVIRAATRGSI